MLQCLSGRRRCCCNSVATALLLWLAASAALCPGSCLPASDMGVMTPAGGPSTGLAPDSGAPAPAADACPGELIAFDDLAGEYGTPSDAANPGEGFPRTWHRLFFDDRAWRYAPGAEAAKAYNAPGLAAGVVAPGEFAVFEVNQHVGPTRIGGFLDDGSTGWIFTIHYMYLTSAAIDNLPMNITGWAASTRQSTAVPVGELSVVLRTETPLKVEPPASMEAIMKMTFDTGSFELDGAPRFAIDNICASFPPPRPPIAFPADSAEAPTEVQQALVEERLAAADAVLAPAPGDAASGEDLFKSAPGPAWEELPDPLMDASADAEPPASSNFEDMPAKQEASASPKVAPASHMQDSSAAQTLAPAASATTSNSSWALACLWAADDDLVVMPCPAKDALASLGGWQYALLWTFLILLAVSVTCCMLLRCLCGRRQKRKAAREEGLGGLAVWQPEEFSQLKEFGDDSALECEMQALSNQRRTY